MANRSPEQQAQEDFLGSAFRVEDLIAINLPPDVRQRSRFLAGGRLQRRYTLEIETEPVLHNLNERDLGRGPAEKIAELAGKNLRAAGRACSAVTQRFRQSAYARLMGDMGGALNRAGKESKRAASAETQDYLRQRYDGGRIGFTPPDPNSTQYGVDSGRLADNMFARINETGRIHDPDAVTRLSSQRSTWTINVPANRLRRDLWMGAQAKFDEWLTQFREMVNLSGIVASPEFNHELALGLERAIGTLQAEQWRLRRAQLAALWGVVTAGTRFLRAVI